ncbi:MAG: N-formylglutamate amidohydrolase [Christiangramia sp.]
MKLVLTCEHAFADIPGKYQNLFIDEPEILKTHEGFDPGSFDLFNHLKSLSDFSYFQKTGRLLVEANRSIWHKKLFSRYASGLTEVEKETILEEFYHPYRKRVEKEIQRFIKDQNEVLHLSIHTFTPVLYEKTRNCDIGLLYDPKRKKEKSLAVNFKEYFSKQKLPYKIRYNYPYLGKADGFTTALRKTFPKHYSGIEIEVNQKWVANNVMYKELKKAIFNTIEALK